MARLAVLFLCLFLWLGFLHTASRVLAHHNIYLPLVPNTPAIQNLLQDGERTWCVNANAANYPNMIAQIQQTYDSQQSKLGNTNRRILGTYESAQAAGAAGCEVWWNGRYDNFCSGCAANVFYANWPVTVNMKLSLGYFDWKTTAGHEEGHVHGLHEQYIDSGSIVCDTSRTDTVMSCGTGVWELKPRDVGFICDLYGVPGDRFHACKPPEPPYYDAARGCMFFGYWCYRYADGVWIDPNNQSEWGPQEWTGDGGFYQYNRRLEQWFRGGQNWESHQGGFNWRCEATCWP